MDIFLFDLDGVLLNSAGYHRSLQETVRLLSLCLGFGDRALTQGEIDSFEANDITAEWDSSAICAALLLVTAWEAGDDPTLPVRPPFAAPRPARHAFPDIAGFLGLFDGRASGDPLVEAERVLLERLGPGRADRIEVLRSLLRSARGIDSLTFRLVQVFNLGSRRFENIYGDAAGWESPSFLEAFDEPTLTEAERSDLLRARARDGRRAVIVTNRPSAASSRRTGQEADMYGAPEAEIGVRVAGFDHLPRITSGDLAPLAKASGLDIQAYLKPSPVHVLAAVRLALGDEVDRAVEAAVRMSEGRAVDPAWQSLDGSRLILFEDAPKGHSSAQAAAVLLRRSGLSVQLEPYGSRSAVKVSLAPVAARYPMSGPPGHGASEVAREVSSGLKRACCDSSSLDTAIRPG
jgi:phosphoglycolate phosphatase-like HAD superfamily hydrolase